MRFLRCCNGETCGGEDTVAEDEAYFGVPFAPQRYLAVEYLANTSGMQLGQNYKWPCDPTSLQTSRDIDPRLLIDSRLLWVTRCTARQLGIPFRLQISQAAAQRCLASFQLQGGNNAKVGKPHQALITCSAICRHILH